MYHLPISIMKKILLAVLLANLTAGCSGPRVLYGGPIRLKPESSQGLVLEGQDKRPIECYADRGDSFTDLKEGQWVVIDGTKGHDGDLAVGVRECHVIAVSNVSPGTDVPGMELRRRVPRPPRAQASTSEKTSTK